MFSSWPAGASLATDPRPYREHFRAQRRSVTPSYISTFWHITAVTGYNVAMSKRQISIIGALWIIIFLFLGFPAWLDKIIAVVTGGIMLGLVYSLRIHTTPETQHAPPPRKSEERHTPYVEHKANPDVTVSAHTDTVTS
jgi:hypothetical protein